MSGYFETHHSIIPILIKLPFMVTNQARSFKLKTLNPIFFNEITYSVSTILASRYDEIVTWVPCHFQYKAIMCSPLKEEMPQLKFKFIHHLLSSKSTICIIVSLQFMSIILLINKFFVTMVL
jgi:hypothetical protein